jgi:hypothetical protein
MLKRDKSDITIVAFIIMPGQTNNYNVESIKGQSIRREIRETCNKIVKKVRFCRRSAMFSANLHHSSLLRLRRECTRR